MNIQRENGIDEVNCAFRMLNMSLDQFIEIQHFGREFRFGL